MFKALAIIGTLDTKGPEVKYIKNLIENRGHKAIVIDIGVLGEVPFKPDISREEVAKKGGKEIYELATSRHREFAMKTMAKGAGIILKELYEAGKIDGVISIGGGQGTYVATTAMRELPIGVPKIMVSTIASGNIRPLVGSKDIAMMFSIADPMGGINTVTRTVLSNATGAIVGMVEMGLKMQPLSGKAVVGMSAMGTTTPAAMNAKRALDEKGYETVMFHASGSCGTAMEELVDQGIFDAVLDLSTHELVGEVVEEDIYAPVKPGRLEAAGRRGIPMVVAPGGLDQLIFGPLSTVPPRFRDRKVAYHSPYVTCIRTSEEELKSVSEIMAMRLNKARGPVAIVIPLRGFSFYDREGELLYDPKVDRAFIDSLKSHLESHVKVIEIDAHINDPLFAERMVTILDGMVTKKK